MAQSITFLGARFDDVPALELPKTGGGLALFADASPTTAAAVDVVSGKVFIQADGSLGTGTLVIQHYYTGSDAPSASLGEDGDVYLQT